MIINLLEVCYYFYSILQLPDVSTVVSTVETDSGLKTKQLISSLLFTVFNTRTAVQARFYESTFHLCTQFPEVFMNFMPCFEQKTKNVSYQSLCLSCTPAGSFRSPVRQCGTLQSTSTETSQNMHNRKTKFQQVTSYH